MWSMTTLVAPVAGPLLGGWITDNFSWPWIFYINIPVGALAVYVDVGHLPRIANRRRTSCRSTRSASRCSWSGSRRMQIMLDKGKELDWFASREIVALAIVAVVGFVFFLIWELTEEHPVVDLRLFARPQFRDGRADAVDRLRRCSSATSCCCRCGCRRRWATPRPTRATCSRRSASSRSCCRRWSDARSAARRSALIATTSRSCCSR